MIKQKVSDPIGSSYDMKHLVYIAMLLVVQGLHHMQKIVIFFFFFFFALVWPGGIIPPCMVTDRYLSHRISSKLTSEKGYHWDQWSPIRHCLLYRGRK